MIIREEKKVTVKKGIKRKITSGPLLGREMQRDKGRGGHTNS